MLGISATTPAIFNSVYAGENRNNSTSKKLLIIGAGVAGMSAGYLFAQKGIDFTILESASTYGGRVKRNTTFADFPIPLGAEWLHVNASILREILNNSEKKVTTKTQGYDPTDPYGYYDGEKLEVSELEEDTDLKFIGSSWFDFFSEYIVPHISGKMKFNTQIVNVDYQTDKVVLTDKQGAEYKADQVIVTAPLKILQEGDIQFNPSLPSKKLNAIKTAPVWGGIKVFLKFSSKFYPTFLEFPDSDTIYGQRLYYDASYAQNSKIHVLGLFAVGKPAEQYLSRSGVELKNYILKELDRIYNGIPSKTYVAHLVQNWNEEPFIRGAYLSDYAPSHLPPIISRSVAHKVFFAGEAYTDGEEWGGVHDAVRSAKSAVVEILKG